MNVNIMELMSYNIDSQILYIGINACNGSYIKDNI